MIRGISKQVIVMEGNSRDFFESAIFILNEDCIKSGVGEKELLQQAKAALSDVHTGTERSQKWNRMLWAFGGFFVSCGLWLLTLLL